MLVKAVLLVIVSSLAVSAATINVHLVPHTHDDVGWLKTVDQYFIGSNNSIQHAGVQYILDSVIPNLLVNKERKFIYVEMAFFERWWNQQTQDMQASVKTLVANGQLEFINGGLCMNDEAATHYIDIIDQMTAGHDFLKRTFGVAPRIGWHIDPFGHSAAQAELFAQMGFDGFFFARIDRQDKGQRDASSNLEFVWRGSKSLGRATDMFTGVLYHHYEPPGGFCFDIFCNDEPVQDDPRINDMNVQRRAEDFVKAAQGYAAHFRTNNVMMTMGSDFQYENAGEWFKNLERLMGYLNQHAELGVNAFYSTPSMYIDALHAANLTWPVKTDDFFPYSDGDNAYWTGYFTSRPALKGYVRWASAYLQACRQVETMVFQKDMGSSVLEDAMGLAQHHDAVSGTSKQHVAFDYAQRISRGQAVCEAVLNQAVASHMPKAEQLVQCPLLNETTCDATSGATAAFSVAFYNSLGASRSEYVRLPVGSANNYSVTDPQGVAVPWSLFKTPELYPPTSGDRVLQFRVIAPAAGWSGAYTVQTVPQSGATVTPKEAKATVNSIENEHLLLTFDATGLASITNKDTQTTTTARQTMAYYTSEPNGQASGAYIFRPHAETAVPVSTQPTVSFTVGSTCSEAQVLFDSWAITTFRLCSGEQHAQVDYQVGPIPVSDNWGKEVITRFDTDLKTNKTWYSDANGREMQQRVRDYRFSYNYSVTEPVSGNYVPVNSATFMRDEAQGTQLGFLTDRSQGCASIQDGSLEIMLHRRLLVDDGRGVGDALNEPGVDGRGLIIRTSHSLLYAPVTSFAALHRPLATRVAAPLLPIISPSALPIPAFSALTADLPPNLHLLTSRLGDDNNSFLLRLTHVFAVDEDAKWSQPVTVDVAGVVAGWKTQTVDELSLSANQEQSAVHRLQWQTTDGAAAAARGQRKTQPARALLQGTSATLGPMDIGTFLLH